MYGKKETPLRNSGALYSEVELDLLNCGFVGLTICRRLLFLYYLAVLDRYTLHPPSPSPHFPIWWRCVHVVLSFIFKHLVTVSSRRNTMTISS